MQRQLFPTDLINNAAVPWRTLSELQLEDASHCLHVNVSLGKDFGYVRWPTRRNCTAKCCYTSIRREELHSQSPTWCFPSNPLELCHCIFCFGGLCVFVSVLQHCCLHFCLLQHAFAFAACAFFVLYSSMWITMLQLFSPNGSVLGHCSTFVLVSQYVQ